MTEAYDGRQVVGMGLHRRRSVLVRMTEDGRKLEIVRITSSPAALTTTRTIARARAVQETGRHSDAYGSVFPVPGLHGLPWLRERGMP